MTGRGARKNAGKKRWGKPGQNRLYASSQRPVYKESVNDRKRVGLEKNLAKGSVFGHAHAYLLYESRGQRAHPLASDGTRKSKIVVVETFAPKPRRLGAITGRGHS